jgi:hypothetical protein
VVLRDKGVRYRARYAEGGTDTVVGYSVRLPGAEHGSRRAVWSGGGRLARDLTLPSLRRGWRKDAEAQRRAVSEWSSPAPSSPRSAAERQAEFEQRGLMWHRCRMELERVRGQLRAGGSEPAAVSHAAREGTGVLAAWSLALEKENPGALARGARQLARSAELPAHTQVSPKPLSRASGLELFMLAAGNPDSAVGWLIVAREIALLAGEIGRVHRARGELDRAQQIEIDLSGELAEVQAQLERDRPQTGATLDDDAQAAK